MKVRWELGVFCQAVSQSLNIWQGFQSELGALSTHHFLLSNLGTNSFLRFLSIFPLFAGAMPEASTQTDFTVDGIAELEKRCLIQTLVLKQGFASPELVKVIECVGAGNPKKVRDTTAMGEVMSLTGTKFVEVNIYTQDDEECDCSRDYRFPATMSLRSLISFAEMNSEKKPVLDFHLSYYPENPESGDEASFHIQCIYQD